MTPHASHELAWLGPSKRASLCYLGVKAFESGGDIVQAVLCTEFYVALRHADVSFWPIFS